MRALKNYIQRARLDDLVRQNLKKQIPHFEFQHRMRRSPLHPKIILYSSLASTDKFIQQIFPTFQLINPKPLAENDDIFTKKIVAEIKSNEHKLTNAAGTLIQGFPFNTIQALTLDRIINGINLAIHLRSEQQSPEFESLLKYYDQRGALLQLEYKENYSLDELQLIQEKVSLYMKLNQ